MAYLGNDLQVAFPVYRNIDDISGSFNSVLTTFPLTVSGVAPIPAPLYSQQCLISVGGVVQRPDDSGTEGFRLSGSNIIFASAPTTGADFFGVILAGADYINAGANFPSGSAAVPSITFDSDLDTGIYNSGANQVSITTSGTERLRIDSAGQIESVSLGTAAAPAFSFTTDANTGIYSPGADQVAISTNGTGRLFVDASGNVGLGSASPTSRLQSAGTIHITSGGTPGSGAGLEIGYGSAAASTTSLISYNRTGAAWLDADYRSLTHQFFTSGSERLRITSAGLVGVGTSAPFTVFHSAKTITGGSPATSGTTDDNVIARIQGGSVGLDIGGTAVGLQWIQPRNVNSFATNYGLAICPNGGNVGIGTTSPSAQLHVQNTGGNSESIVGQYGTGVQAKIGAYADGIIVDAANSGSTSAQQNLRFSINGTERARIDSSGRLLVGTSSGSAQVHIGSSQDSLFIDRNETTVGGSNAAFRKARGSTGSPSIVSDSDVIGTLSWRAYDGSTYVSNAFIRGEVDGTPGANDMPGRLVFSTTADGASSPTERMRIAQNGVITIQNGAVAVIGTLTDGATITPDFAADCNFTVTLGGNRTIANPTNITAGQSGSIFIVQDGTGSRTLSWGSYWDFPGGTAPTLSTAANAVDRIDYIVRSSTSIHTVFTANYS